MTNELLVLLLLIFSAVPATAQLSVAVQITDATIGINLGLYPNLKPIPGYPVYYAPDLDSNYFFYDGLYWIFLDDDWYDSAWYNGPWRLVDRDEVPLYVLRIPVRYYRRPPSYFHGWRSNAPPRWAERWGQDWQQRRAGWDRWNRRAAPAAAPLPSYQRQFTGDRYPDLERQHDLRSDHYRYQPRDPVVRQHYQAPPPQRIVQPGPRAEPAPPARPMRRPAEEPRDRRPRQDAVRHQQPEFPSHDREAAPQGRAAPRETNRGPGHGQERDRQKDDEPGRGRGR